MASEYGWALTEILEHVYIDDLFFLVPKIRERQNDNYKMQLAIVQNPHVKDPKQLWRMLNQSKEERPAELDVTSFALLKSRLAKDTAIAVK